jgi:hypothetical protein
MAVYSIFVALGLETTVRPVLEHDERWFEDEELDEMDESEDESISATNIFDRAFVRDDLTEVVTSYEGGYDGDSYRDIIESFHGREMRVNWLTHLKKQNRNIGMVHLTVCSLPNIVKKC